MVKAMTLREFEKLIASHGCRLVQSKRHHRVETKAGELVCRVAIKHPAKIVLACYISDFLKSVKP
jgi:hypothetical protein